MFFTLLSWIYRHRYAHVLAVEFGKLEAPRGPHTCRDENIGEGASSHLPARVPLSTSRSLCVGGDTTVGIWRNPGQGIPKAQPASKQSGQRDQNEHVQSLEGVKSLQKPEECLRKQRWNQYRAHSGTVG